MNFLENITFRRNRTRSVTSVATDDASEIMSQTLESTANSMPDLSNEEDEQIKCLNDKLLDLETQLQSAHREIELLSSENCELRQTNEELLKKNSLYKKITSSPVKHKVTSPMKTSSKTMKVKQTQTETLDQEYSKPSTASSIIHSSQNSINNVKIIKHQDQNAKTNTRPVETVTSTQEPRPRQNASKTNKICILSNNNVNKIMSISDTTLQPKSEICHYLMPHRTVDQMMQNIETKVQSFTINDFCIILIGEEEINSKDYPDFIFSIRASISKIKQTNFIICAPTFKYGNYSNLFNGRIEHFNSLLYRDILTHEHAYFLDSNKNLSYDYTMFYRRNGKLNNTGMRAVFQDLNVLLLEINQYNADSIEANMIPYTQEDEDNLTRQFVDKDKENLFQIKYYDTVKTKKVNKEKLTKFFRH